MRESLRTRVDRIVGKLAQVRAQGLSCFGSDTHQFQLRAPLPEADLLAFEARQGVRLPEAYRVFLLHAGDGGAGPHYGIFPLSQWDDFVEWVGDDDMDDVLARPCPLSPNLRLTQDWEDQFDDVLPYQGTLSLGSRGCSFATQLIVSGPAAGKVVYVDADGSPPYIVHEPDFLAWYERWLDELLHGYTMTAFGYGPGGDEHDFVRLLNDPHTSDDLAAEAARAFCRLPRVSEATARCIPAYLQSRIAGVRAGALATIRRFTLTVDIAAVIRLLDDPTAAVRRQTVSTVMQLAPDQARTAVLDRLHTDINEDVAMTAFFQLKKAGALSKQTLLRLITQSPLGNLRYNAAYVVTWTPDDRPTLVTMVSDAHSRVRLTGVTGLRRINARDAVPLLIEVLARETDELVVDTLLSTLGALGDSSTVPVLLHWAVADDDFYRLHAIEALIQLGDERALPVVRAALAEQRPPVRRSADGQGTTSHVQTIRVLVQKMLSNAPNQAWRTLTE